MKKNILIILLSLSAGIFSCEQFLEDSPKGIITTETFFNNEAELEGALFGVYDIFTQTNMYYYWQGIWFYGDACTDICTNRYRGYDENSWTITPANGNIQAFWNASYQVINQANIVIERAPDVPMGEAKRNQIVAEAKFLRALSYYNLVLLYNDVPMPLTPTASLDAVEAPQVDAIEILTQIEKDLKEAESILPDAFTGSSLGRATNGAASALLAKTYLAWAGFPFNDNSKWQMAATKAIEVINSNKYSLQDDYMSVFATDNENNAEIIYDIQFSAGNGAAWVGTGNILSHMCAPAVGWQKGAFAYPGASSHYFPSQNFYNSFEEGDERKEGIINYVVDGKTGDTVFFDQPASRRYFAKHTDPAVIQSRVTHDSEKNYTLIRYADILLVAAEALNNAGQTETAYQYINEVRERAGLDPLSGLSQSEFIDAVLEERAHELYMENSRRYDLVRYERLIEVAINHALTEPSNRLLNRVEEIEDHEWRLPIPQTEVDLNENLNQHPEWSNN